MSVCLCVAKCIIGPEREGGHKEDGLASDGVGRSQNFKERESHTVSVFVPGTHRYTQALGRTLALCEVKSLPNKS